VWRREPAADPGQPGSVSRLPRWIPFLLALALLATAWAQVPAGPGRPEVVATGIPRPAQIVVDGRGLTVLGPGVRGDAAGELYHVDLDAPLPVDLAMQASRRLGFSDGRTATLGSLALDPATRQLFLGEENGTRVYRLELDGRLARYAIGLHRVPAGGALAFDAQGRLLVLDFVDRTLAPGEDSGPRGLEPLREGDYRGPLLFRLTLDPSFALPRRLDRLVPLFPRLGETRTEGYMGHFIAVAPLPSGEVALLDPTGAVLRLLPDGAVIRLARLPRPGEYNRTSMVAAPDGSLFVSGGFHVGRVFRVSPAGAVETVAEGLRDPAGLALDAGGNLYIAESSRHRILRLRVALAP
jgi:NHL repeat